MHYFEGNTSSWDWQVKGGQWTRQPVAVIDLYCQSIHLHSREDLKDEISQNIIHQNLLGVTFSQSVNQNLNDICSKWTPALERMRSIEEMKLPTKPTIEWTHIVTYMHWRKGQGDIQLQILPAVSFECQGPGGTDHII